jgi:hypothetical protein
MDELAYGVKATLIDLGLSRMDAGDGQDGVRVHWTPFAEEIFMGEGEYQFDIYRIMREHNGGAWEGYRPLTNVMVSCLFVGFCRSSHCANIVVALPITETPTFKTPETTSRLTQTGPVHTGHDVHGKGLLQLFS